MENILQTKARYGIFARYLHRLLLWRRTDENMGGIVYRDQQFPSWSWMTYSGIEFLPLERLKVPIHTDLRFDTERRDVLLVQVRAIQNCSLELKEGRHVIVDAHSKVVGDLWLDITSNTYFQYCVVIGMKDEIKVDPEMTYYILLVEEIPSENECKRIGVGNIKARCVSRESWERKLL